MSNCPRHSSTSYASSFFHHSLVETLKGPGPFTVRVFILWDD
jgi:hypothetical protein